ncbi:MAG: hypothetical protein WBZ40_12250, partial [Acidimicrobiia bacterium]
GKARALHAAAEQVRRVGDEIARREYIRFVARLIGADLDTVTAAVEGGRRRSRPATTVSQRPLDRMESELLRFLIANPDRMAEVGPDDFVDEILAAAFVALSTGESAERSANGDGSASEASGLLRSLSMEDRPASGEEIMGRIKERRLDRLIDALETELAELEPGSEPHSDSLRRLIALQKEKRSLAES